MVSVLTVERAQIEVRLGAVRIELQRAPEQLHRLRAVTALIHQESEIGVGARVRRGRATMRAAIAFFRVGGAFVARRASRRSGSDTRRSPVRARWPGGARPALRRVGPGGHRCGRGNSAAARRRALRRQALEALERGSDSSSCVEEELAHGFAQALGEPVAAEPAVADRGQRVAPTAFLPRRRGASSNSARGSAPGP